MAVFHRRHQRRGDGLHALVAGMIGHAAVFEGAFRPRVVGLIFAKLADVNIDAAGFLAGLPEHLILSGVRPETAPD